MNGFTLFVETDPEGRELVLHTCHYEHEQTELEGRILGCIEAAVAGCLRELKAPETRGVSYSHEPVSLRAQKIFREHLRAYLSQKRSMN